MSVYSLNLDEFEFFPVLTTKNQHQREPEQQQQRQPGESSFGSIGTAAATTGMPTNYKKFAGVKRKPSAFRTISSNDVLMQLENSSHRIRPTPKQQNFGKAVLPDKDVKDNATTAGFRPILRQTNSESDLDVHLNRENYRSPQVFLSVRKYFNEVPSYFDKLSDELILAIFQYLPKSTLVRCNSVCRRWDKLSKDETLWKRIDLGGKRMNASILHVLLSRGIQIMRLAKAEISCDLVASPRTTSPCRLQYLDLSMLVTEDQSIIRRILTRCHFLEALSLESCDVDTDCCVAISRNLNLKILNLCLCRGLTSVGLSHIFDGCPKLTELNVSWASLDVKAVDLTCRMLPESVVRLNISGCRFGSMGDEDILNLVEACPNLVELDISDCTDLTAKALQFIYEGLRFLQVLHCSRCYAVDPMAYTGYCKQLTELNIFGTIKEESMPILKRALKDVEINRSLFSTIARPTVGIKRTSIWERRTRDE